jgi:hypothetical protein
MQASSRYSAIQPALNLKRFDVFCNFPTPTSDEVIADDMLRNDRCNFRLGADGIRAEIGPKVMLREGIEPDATRRGVVVDTVQDSEPVDLTPYVLILWEFLDNSDGRGVFFLRPCVTVRSEWIHSKKDVGTSWISANNPDNSSTQCTVAAESARDESR